MGVTIRALAAVGKNIKSVVSHNTPKNELRTLNYNGGENETGYGMNFTAYQMQIATLIDNQVTKIIETKKTSSTIDEAIVEMMPDYQEGFKHLLDTLDSDGMNNLCEEFSGFYRFAKMMERIAEGCKDGIFDDTISTQRNS